MFLKLILLQGTDAGNLNWKSQNNQQQHMHKATRPLGPQQHGTQAIKAQTSFTEQGGDVLWK